MNTTLNSDTGSLRRGVALLKLLATAGRRGLALTELSQQANMPHPSVHRLLRQLVEERLAVHNPETRRYRLGPLAFELGVAGSTMHDIRDLCDPSMTALARQTGDTVYLVVRSGFDAVCMHRREGDFPVRALVLEVGSRRPLGVGAGGLAILAAIREDERQEVIERVAPQLSQYGRLSTKDLAAACVETRALGMAVIQNRVNLGVKAVGVPFHDTMGQPIGALSVAALAQRMDAARTSAIAARLQEAAHAVALQLRQRTRSGKASHAYAPPQDTASSSAHHTGFGSPSDWQWPA